MFLYGELSVVISAMAVWMDLKDASVDNGWILFSFMIGFLIQITDCKYVFLQYTPPA